MFVKFDNIDNFDMIAHPKHLHHETDDSFRAPPALPRRLKLRRSKML